MLLLSFMFLQQMGLLRHSVPRCLHSVIALNASLWRQKLDMSPFALEDSLSRAKSCHFVICMELNLKSVDVEQSI